MSNSVIPWTVAQQAPLSMGLPRQEYWSGLPFPSPGDLPDPEIETRSLRSLLHWQVGSLPLLPPGKLDTKASLQKTAPPAPSVSSAEPVRGAAQRWKCPFWGLAWSPHRWPGSLSGPPPSWGTQQRLSVPPGHRGRGPCSSPILVEVQCQDPFSPRSWDTTASFGYSLLERLL